MFRPLLTRQYGHAHANYLFCRWVPEKELPMFIGSSQTLTDAVEDALQQHGLTLQSQVEAYQLFGLGRESGFRLLAPGDVAGNVREHRQSRRRCP